MKLSLSTLCAYGRIQEGLHLSPGEESSMGPLREEYRQILNEEDWLAFAAASTSCLAALARALPSSRSSPKAPLAPSYAATATATATAILPRLA